MPFNLLLFPLIGGYYFLINSRYFKYYHQRIDRQKLIFNSILLGILFVTLAFVFTSLFDFLFPAFISSLKALLPIEEPYTGTTLLSLGLAIGSAHISNLFVSDVKAIAQSIRKIGNELEILIQSSFEEKIMIQFTMKSDKIYVGWASELPKPQKSDYISIMPALSGYRDEKTKEIKFTTSYVDLYDTFINEGKIEDLDKLNFQLILSKSEIVTANRFDLEIYDLFNRLGNTSR